MANMVVWPAGLLTPESIEPNQVPFSRTGGRTLNGLQRGIRTDRGYWEISMNNVPLRDSASRRAWNAVRTTLAGISGLAIIPIWNKDSWPFDKGTVERVLFATETADQPNSSRIRTVDNVAIGATSIRLSVERQGVSGISGVTFSYNNALYETGFHQPPSGNIYTCPIFPAVRAPIPAGSDLNFDLPTCLVHLKDDRGMDTISTAGGFDLRSVTWVEATDYWSDLAAGLLP